MRIKEKEQTSEKLELFNMRKEDERTIQVQRKKDKQLEKEIANKNCKILIELGKKHFEFEREDARKKLEEERIIKEKEEQTRKEAEYLKKILEQNNTCSICKINYCKCDTPNFIIDKHNRSICATCNKRKCKCVRITNFFKR